VAERGPRHGEAWRAERAKLRTLGADTAPAPPRGALEFEPLAHALTTGARTVERALGTQEPQTEITGEGVRNGIAIAAALLMKTLLTFGQFVGLERARQPAPRSTTSAREEREPTHVAPPPPLRPMPALSARRPARTSQIRRFGRGGELRWPHPFGAFCPET